MASDEKPIWSGARSEERAAGSGAVMSGAFYGEYHGHRVAHLQQILPELRKAPGGRAAERSVVWLCGDSTLDNKYWLPHRSEAGINGFERALSGPMQPDVAYWVNSELVSRGLGDRVCCVNCAVEESTLGGRMRGGLEPQDGIIAEHIRDDDVLVVSAGGNDIALRPTLWTVMSMATLIMTPRWLISAGLAPGLGHFIRLFRDDTSRLVRALLARARAGELPRAAKREVSVKPRAVVACMLYYLDEAQTDSWANFTLSKLGYDKDPAKLQLIMHKVYELATREVAVAEGVRVVPLPFFEALDGKDVGDYVQRVEPSSQGGRKMARAVLDRIEGLFE